MKMILGDFSKTLTSAPDEVSPILNREMENQNIVYLNHINALEQLKEYIPTKKVIELEPD